MNGEMLQKMREVFRCAMEAGLGEEKKEMDGFSLHFDEIYKMVLAGNSFSTISKFLINKGLDINESKAREYFSLNNIARTIRVINETQKYIEEELKQRADVPKFVYEDGLLEHPAIPGLMLTRENRVQRTFLRYKDLSNQLQIETTKERLLRIKWIKPV